MHARFVMASAALAALAGCAAPMATQDPAQRMAAIDSTRAGTAVLSCGNDLSCALRWQNVRQTALQDAAAQQWADLAALVIGAGYNADVSWYYLGQAAQGMGSYDAARQYFNTAIGDAAAGGPAACAGGVVDLCNGVAVANDAQMLLSQVPGPGGRAACVAAQDGHPPHRAAFDRFRQQPRFRAARDSAPRRRIGRAVRAARGGSGAGAGRTAGAGRQPGFRGPGSVAGQFGALASAQIPRCACCATACCRR